MSEKWDEIQHFLFMTLPQKCVLNLSISASG